MVTQLGFSLNDTRAILTLNENETVIKKED